jgi:hypothetical protein
MITCPSLSLHCMSQTAIASTFQEKVINMTSNCGSQSKVSDTVKFKPTILNIASWLHLPYKMNTDLRPLYKHLQQIHPVLPLIQK